MRSTNEQAGGLVPRMVRSVIAMTENDALMRKAEWASGLVLLLTIAGSYYLLSAQTDQVRLLSPLATAALLVANLTPVVALLILYGRRLAKRRAGASASGSNGRMHVRLVGLFSLVAAIPMLLVVFSASLLFQYGVDFWFSDRARGMLENANELARGYYEQNRQEVGEETITMANDLRTYLRQARLDSPEFAEGYVFQVLSRKLNESAIIEIGKDGVARTAAVVDPDKRDNAPRISPEIVKRLQNGENYVVSAKANKIEAVTPLDLAGGIFLYAARDSDMLALSQWERAQLVLRDYDDLFDRSRNLQVQFNIALFVLSLLIIGIALRIGLIVADRMVRPVNDLVTAAKRVTEGDLATRVPVLDKPDEVGTLSRAFNRMTERLEMQTTALITANDQLGNRRIFIETVLGSVASGIISIDAAGVIQLANSRAQALLAKENDDLAGLELRIVAPELAQLLEQGMSEAIVQLTTENEIRTLNVKIVDQRPGHVMTFEDITQQLLDQRRAAWSDVARRIAHEIKNPLTPIQLAAERLQRRFGSDLPEGGDVFAKLTGTIVRQVGDLRNIVDEFSSFARMPKPVFREENLTDILKQALFMQEVANPAITFHFDAPEQNFPMVCDRRQLAQAMINVTKNAVEAIHDRGSETAAGEVRMALSHADDLVVITLDDNGIGLPKERDRIVEPYVTNREKGTGLGLAIVKKIVEEHFGEISFADGPLGGARVQITFNQRKLRRLSEHPAAAVQAAEEGQSHGA